MRKFILLVEDDPDDVELALRALQRHHIANQVVVVRDGAEALEFLYGEGAHVTRNPADLPEVVLLDLNLPKVRGLQVLQRIRADARTRFLPVVVLTTSSEERDVVESYRLGANSYIRKPVDFDQFTEAMRQLGMYWLVLNQNVKRPGEL